MAEALGIAASVISIADLGVGILKTGVKIADFIKDVKELHHDLQHGLERLRIHSSHLQHFSKLDAEQPNVPSFKEARSHYERCNLEVETIYHDCIDQIQNSKGVRRTARMLKIVLKKDFILKVEHRLSKSLECISLANQAYFMYSLQLQGLSLQSQGQKLDELLECGTAIKQRLAEGVTTNRQSLENEITCPLEPRPELPIDPTELPKKVRRPSASARILSLPPIERLMNQFNLIWRRRAPTSAQEPPRPSAPHTDQRLRVFITKHSLHDCEIVDKLLSSIDSNLRTINIRNGLSQPSCDPMAWLAQQDHQAGGKTGDMLAVTDLYERLICHLPVESGKLPFSARRLHILNPDSWSVVVLILASQANFAQAVCKWLERHFRSESLFVLCQKPAVPPADSASSEQSESKDDSDFTWECHMPYFAWRRAAKPPVEENVSNVTSRRRLHDLSFLKFQSGQSTLTDYLHEGQASFLFTGSRHSGWTAYLLKDSHQLSDVMPATNMKFPCSVQTSTQEEPCIDPLTKRTVGASMATTDAREYQCIVLKAWVREICEEWTNTVYQLKDRVTACRGELGDYTPETRKQWLVQEVQSIPQKHIWIDRIMILLNKLKTSLSKLLKAWSKSSKRTLEMIASSSQLISCGIDEISYEFEQLEELCDDLGRLAMEMEARREDLRKRSKISMVVLKLRENGTSWRSLTHTIAIIIIMVVTVICLLFFRILSLGPGLVMAGKY